MADAFKNFIDGQWLAAKSAMTFENRNPANRDDLIGLFPASAARRCGCCSPSRKKCLCQVASDAGAEAW